MEQYLTFSQAQSQLGLTRTQLVQAIWHKKLTGHKNGGGQWMYLTADSVKQYQAEHDKTLPPGYITPQAAMELTGWTWRAIADRLSRGIWHGVKCGVSWLGVLEADIRRDVHLRCKRCEILLEPDEPGPLCKWCQVGGTDCAGQKVARPMCATVIKVRRTFSSGKKT